MHALPCWLMQVRFRKLGRMPPRTLSRRMRNPCIQLYPTFYTTPGAEPNWLRWEKSACASFTGQNVHNNKGRVPCPGSGHLTNICLHHGLVCHLAATPCRSTKMCCRPTLHPSCKYQVKPSPHPP